MNTQNATLRIALALALSFIGTSALLAQARPAESQKRPTERAEHRENGEAEEHEHALPAARVPAAVRNAVRNAYPAANVTKWTSEVEGGKTIYEAETVDGSTHRDLNISAEGTIVETETQVTLAQLPGAVRTAATANNARIDMAEVVVVGRDTTYEMKIHGRPGELKLRSNGTPVPAEHPAPPARRN